MYYIIEKDNFNRDYHPDKVVVKAASKYLISTLLEVKNTPNGSDFYEIVDTLEGLYFDSMHDCNGYIPTLEEFLSYTGLELEPEQGTRIYNNRYKNTKE